MMFSHGLCGHLALGTLLETWRKESVFETNVQDQNIDKHTQVEKCHT